MQDSNKTYPEEWKKDFFSKAPCPSIKVLEGCYFADEHNYFIFVFAIGFKKRLKNSNNAKLTSDFKRKDKGIILLIHRFFTESIIRGLMLKKESDKLLEARTTSFMHNLKTFNLQLSHSIFKPEHSLERYRGKILTNFIAVNIEWFEMFKTQSFAHSDGKNWFPLSVFLENIFIQAYLLFYKDALHILDSGTVVEQLKKIGGFTVALKSASIELPFDRISQYLLTGEELTLMLTAIENTGTIQFVRSSNKPDKINFPYILISFSSQKPFFIELYLHIFELAHNAIKHGDKFICYYHYQPTNQVGSYLIFSNKKLPVITESLEIQKHHQNNREKLRSPSEVGHYGLILFSRFLSRNGCELSHFKIGTAESPVFIRCIKIPAYNPLFKIQN